VTTHWTERLSEFIDGELSQDDQTACEAHLTACAECRTIATELRLVTATARADAEQTPRRDLWPGILTQIGSGDIAAHGETRAAVGTERVTPVIPMTRARRQVTFSLPQLALAASLLIAVTAGVSYVASGRGARTTPVRGETPVQAMAESMGAPGADVTRANFADEQFDRAVADLEQILVDQRDDLDPRTVVVIERNLAVIDEAIRQARAALDADPANTFLNSHLADARRRKLELLRRATTIGGD
jgi:negative regulator of sigma E activity